MEEQHLPIACVRTCNTALYSDTLAEEWDRRKKRYLGV